MPTLVSMLIAETALADLRGKLVAEGFDEARPHLAVLWSAVKAWATQPVDAVAEDGLHFECSLDLAGPARGRGEPAFTVGFQRFFSFEDDDGDYIGMQRSGVDLRYAVEDEFRAITQMADWNPEFVTADSIWGSGGARAGDWVAQVQASQSFRVALAYQAVGVGWSATPV